MASVQLPQEHPHTALQMSHQTAMPHVLLVTEVTMVHVAGSVSRLTGLTCRRHALPLHLLKHGDLLLQEVIEQHYLVLELETGVVCLEEVRILLLQLLPHQLREAWLHFGLLLQGVNHLHILGRCLA